MTRNSENGTNNPVEENRARRLDAIRVLDEIFKTLTEPGYSGSGKIEIHAQKGAIKVIKSGTERFH